MISYKLSHIHVLGISRFNGQWERDIAKETRIKHAINKQYEDITNTQHTL